MKIFLDTANVDHIRGANARGVVDGVTTNPSLIAQSGRKFEDVVREMLQNVVDIYPTLPDNTFVMAKQVNFESIHKHDAIAERSGTLGEIRGEILGAQQLTRHTSLQEWLGG